MRKSRFLVSAVVAIVAFLPAGNATADSHSCTSLEVVEALGHYVDVRDDIPANVNVWIYEESNNIAGLQRGGEGDESCVLLDAQGQPIPADTVIF